MPLTAAAYFTQRRSVHNSILNAHMCHGNEEAMYVFVRNRMSDLNVRNAILWSISPSQRERILAASRLESVPAGMVLSKAHEPISDVYFIEEGIVSLIVALSDGPIEAYSIGNSGMIGLPVYLGCEHSTLEARQSIAGSAYRLAKDVFLTELAREPGLGLALSKFAQAVLTTGAIQSACYNQHSVEQQLIRWLLVADDHMEGGSFRITHQLLAELLGTRRATITTYAHTLLEAGYVDYHRGSVRVLNRVGLEALSCECYSRMRKQYIGADDRAVIA